MSSEAPTFRIPLALAQELRDKHPTGSVTIPLNQDPASILRFQPLLRQVRALQEVPATRDRRLTCQCNDNAAPFYVHKGRVSDALFIARMPNTGTLHDRSCCFYFSEFLDLKKEAICPEPDNPSSSRITVSFGFGPGGSPQPRPRHSDSPSPLGHPSVLSSPRSALTLADFLHLLVHCAGLNYWSRKFQEHHRFNPSEENPWRPIFRKMWRQLQDWSFKGMPDAHRYINVGWGIPTKDVQLPSRHIRIDVVRTIFPPSSGKHMHTLTFFGSGAQTFLLPPNLAQRAALEIHGCSHDGTYIAPRAKWSDELFALAAVQISLERTGRSPCLRKIAQLEILSINYLGIPTATETERQACDILLSQQRPFLRPLLRDEIATACMVGRRLPFAVFFDKRDLVACELVSADQFAELKRRYEMQHKPVEFLHV